MIEFVPLKEADLLEVKKIYDHYIFHSTITFHTQPVSIEELKEFVPINHPLYQSFMISYSSSPVGYCYLAQYKKRQAYDRTAEVTIYLNHAFCGKGIGGKAIQFLEELAVAKGLKNLIAIISGDNMGSIKLFEKQQYIKCAHFKNVGEKFGKILDIVAYQKEL